MNRAAPAAVALLVLAAGCRHPSPPVLKTAAPSVPAPTFPWARETLARLTLPQKAAQLVGVRAFGIYRNPASNEARKLLQQVQELEVGTVVVFESEVESLPRLLNELQSASRLPLLVAADMERGLAFRVRRGVVPLPYAMAVGATGSEAAAAFVGEVTAREGRALGIQWAFAPVADVNNNPHNPIVNIRSYGEDPELVARLSGAFVRAARAGGILTTAKHFPGHGDTNADSHLQLALVEANRDRLDAVELLPFRRAVNAGVDSVMLGHIAVPALDPSGAPATLSAPVAHDLLRNELGFTGLVVTDAMEMQGVRAAWTGEAAIGAIRAGADLILLPPEPEVAVQALVRAVKEGQLTEERIDQSVRRILEAKERLGLHDARRVDLSAIGRNVGRPEDVARALAIAQESITLVRNEGGTLPLREEDRLRLLHLVLSSDARNEAIQGIPEAELRVRGVPTETLTLGPEVSEETAADILARAPTFTHVLVSAFVKVTGSKGTADMSPSHARLISALQAAGRPVVVVSFGSPYLLRQFPEVPAYVCAYGSAESSQRAAIAALFGEHDLHGRLPVTLPGLFPAGHGLRLARRDMTLQAARPEDAGFRSEGLAALDQAILGFVADKAFPGAVVAVGRKGRLAHLKAYGRLSYDEDAAEVGPDTLYDLASLTKAVATTTMAMILVDEGKLDLNKPVAAFLPGFQGPGKERVTVWHLLTHSSGLDWWAPLYQELKGKQAYLERVQSLDLVYEPGTRSLYSDLGVVLLGEILERVAGEPLDTFVARRVFAPLGMTEARFRPGAELRPRIAPTELDPWRGRVVRGEVHDENAFAMGGIAPHAGLFDTAGDLARFAQMLLNGGVYDHKRIVSRETVDRFTRRAGVPGSSRALGWDTPSPPSSAGALFSPRSFGHTGFTGTSMWMDPDRGVFVILLTNRVHPSRENKAIQKARPVVADAVIQALLEP